MTNTKVEIPTHRLCKYKQKGKREDLGEWTDPHFPQKRSPKTTVCNRD